MMQFKRFIRTLSVTLALAASIFGVSPAYAWEEIDYIIASGHGTINPSYLVIHSTANPGATAWNHVQYWQRLGNDALMTQWVCDWTGDGTVYQVAPSSALTWHVGNGNRHSVGIEICEGTTREQVDKSIDTAAKWAAYFLNSRGWGIDRMVSHNDARYIWGGTTHTDPLPYFSRWGYTWEGFKAKVAGYMTRGPGESAPSAGDSGSASASDFGDPAYTGPLMWSEMQDQLGTPVDGHISGQSYYNAYIVQWAVTVSPYEQPSYGSISAIALQHLLISRGYDVGPSGVDGHLGRDTVQALQRYLNDKLGAGLAIDGYWGTLTSTAVCEGLQKKLFE